MLAVLPSWLWVWPFVALLLAIAVLPLIPRVDHWWHKNRNKLLVSGGLAGVALLYYGLRGFGVGHAEQVTAAGWATVVAIARHALLVEFFPFISLLFSLYVIAGGIVVRGNIRATPLANTTLLAVGGLLANLIGTTGASMVMIRLVLKTNSGRKHVVHTVIFFIFIVSNVGGCLLPIGDPPLFLGYLRGVPFLWTLSLWSKWAVMLGLLLLIYFIFDTVVQRREPAFTRSLELTRREPLHVAGLLNLVWLAGVVATVALLVPGKTFPGTAWVVPAYLREGLQLTFAGLALLTTPPRLRLENDFNFVAIGEVACLFVGIFITMQIPLEILQAYVPHMAETAYIQPWAFFWATGLLSSFLDNAPTYIVFFETANHLTPAPGPGRLQLLSSHAIRSDLLAAISCGAVFMGANSYIGNGPNFMVKSIAEQAGVRMPTFFGYMGWSALILLPLFGVLTALFFV